VHPLQRRLARHPFSHLSRVYDRPQASFTLLPWPLN
jgi:hypothetical protein